MTFMYHCNCFKRSYVQYLFTKDFSLSQKRTHIHVDVVMYSTIIMLYYLRLGESYATLYWSLFGITAKHDLKIQNGQTFTEMLGRLMFMLYHCMAIIVLINMLIAMMSNSFQNIEASPFTQSN